jgi:hypothetical protein
LARSRSHELLTTNEPPYPVEDQRYKNLRANLQERLLTVRARKEALQAEIRAVVDEEAALEGELSKYSGIISPLRRFPVEIIREIFARATEPDPELWTRRSCVHSAFTALILTRVCRRWREIAISFPLIWSHIGIDITSSIPDSKINDITLLLSLQLHRASHHPLTISLYSEGDQLARMAPLLPSLAASAATWEELCISSDVIPGLTSIQGQLPLLQRLFLLPSERELDDHTGIVLTTFEACPSLNTLNGFIVSLRRMGLPWSQIKYSSLFFSDALHKGRSAGSGELLEAHSLLRSMTQLDTLQLWLSFKDHKSKPQQFALHLPAPSTTNLPKLTSLSLHCEGYAGNFLQAMQFALPDLGWLSIYNMSASMYTSLLDFLKGSTYEFTSLSLVGHEFSDPQLLTLLDGMWVEELELSPFVYHPHSPLVRKFMDSDDDDVFPFLFELVYLELGLDPSSEDIAAFVQWMYSSRGVTVIVKDIAEI